MTSVNDTTILAMFSQYPNISDSEADRQLLLLEHEENREICEVLLGREPENILDHNQLRTYREFIRWASDHTFRTRNEQIVARRQNRSTRLRDRMVEMHTEGIITDEVLSLYAMSGPLPSRLEYSRMTAIQKEEFWEERAESNLGVEWRVHLGDRADFMKMPVRKKVNWAKEGF